MDSQGCMIRHRQQTCCSPDLTHTRYVHSAHIQVHSILFLDQIWFIWLILGQHVVTLWPVCGSVPLKYQHSMGVGGLAEGAWYSFVIWAWCHEYMSLTTYGKTRSHKKKKTDENDYWSIYRVKKLTNYKTPGKLHRKPLNRCPAWGPDVLTQLTR